MSVLSTKVPVVYMDETGNKESDRFFVMGFLKVPNSEQLNAELMRIKEQIEALSRFNSLKHVQTLLSQQDIDQLYNFAKSSGSFELKYKHITAENLHFFKILIKILVHKVDFSFDALVIDRNDPNYIHTNLTDMYKIISHRYFNYRCKETCIFVPDSFDYRWNWSSVLNNTQIVSIIPSSSHALLALQVVDILTGLIAQGLKDQSDYTNKDVVRAPLLKVFTEESKMHIQKSITINKPKYISIWTLDFSKTKRGAQSMDKKSNLGS